MSMDKAEIKQIADFLNDVYEGLCEGDEEAAMRLHLTELYRVIKRLMDATFAAQDQGLKALLATMAKKAQRLRRQISAVGKRVRNTHKVVLCIRLELLEVLDCCLNMSEAILASLLSNA